MKILHVLYQSLPDTAGSSIRSRDILMSQKEIGLKPLAITSPFQIPLDNNSFDTINDVKYYRTYANNENLKISENKKTFFVKIKKLFQIFSFMNKVYKIAKEENVDVIHAHATFFCGLAAKYASIRLNKPCVYEVRSLWEERRKKLSNSFFEKIQLASTTFIETLTMKLATNVIAINQNLYENLLERGIKKDKLHIVANAVNLNIIKETKTTNDKLTFGYIGSISPIEGLDLLIKSFNKLKKEDYENKLLIYGSGNELPNLEKLVNETNAVNVELKGHIKSEEIYKAYQTIDVIVNPRTKSKIADTVTPLKPLEAMGNKKLVLASDVGGMKELIKDNESGYLFKADDFEDLFNKIKFIIDNGISQKIVEDAYEYVKKEKSWLSNAKKYENIYNNLVRK
jgi:glycogen synthase